MSQQQPEFDPWTNSNQTLCGGGNALAVVRARADALARDALIIRARALLEEAISAQATPVRLFIIELARSRLAKRMATNAMVTLTLPSSPWISIMFWLSDFVLCLKTQTALFRATLLIQAFCNFVFIILYYTLLYFT